MPHTIDTGPVGIDVFRSDINVEVRVQPADAAWGQSSRVRETDRRPAEDDLREQMTNLMTWKLHRDVLKVRRKHYCWAQNFKSSTMVGCEASADLCFQV